MKIQLSKENRITPKTLINKYLDYGLRDLKEDRVYGPFDSAVEMMKSLKVKTSAKK